MCWPAWLRCSPAPGRREEGGEEERAERAGALPGSVAEVEAGLPESAAPLAAVAS